MRCRGGTSHAPGLYGSRTTHTMQNSVRERAKSLLEEINKRVQILQREFERLYATALKDLRDNRIYLINEKQLNARQLEFVRRYFFKRGLGKNTKTSL